MKDDPIDVKFKVFALETPQCWISPGKSLKEMAKTNKLTISLKDAS